MDILGLDLMDVLEKVVFPMSGIFLGALLGILSSYLLWRRQRKQEEIDARFKEFTAFFASNSDLSFGLEYCRNMQRTLSRLCEMKDADKEVTIPLLPAKYGDFLIIDKAIFSVINNTKTFIMASNLYHEGKKTKHRFDSIHEKFGPTIRDLVFKEKGKDSPEYQALINDDSIRTFHNDCKSFEEFAVKQLYLSHRFRAIKMLGYHKKKYIKGKSSAEANIDRQAEKWMEEYLEKFFEANPNDAYAKESVFSHWRDLKKELKEMDEKNSAEDGAKTHKSKSDS